MKFDVKKVEKKKLPSGYPEESYNTARKFAELAYKEFGDFINGIILFGSVVRKGAKPQDIDILIILDDVKMVFTEEIVQTYRIVMEKTIAQVDRERLHVQSMKFTNFWEYVRAGDPVAMNILRFGVALVDTGFFSPLQLLLDQGRIRPTKESVYTYFVMAPASITRAKQHMLQATVDLYWSVIDAAHAALMKYGEVPPSPNHVAEMMERTLIKHRKVSKSSAATMKEMYKVFKGITGRSTKEVSGKQYDAYKKKCEAFVKDIKKYIDKKQR
ncbi:MAG: hypothetical protein ABIB71_03215 [Candidatus Woesearchaeota archaeon]